MGKVGSGALVLGGLALLWILSQQKAQGAPPPVVEPPPVITPPPSVPPGKDEPYPPVGEIPPPTVDPPPIYPDIDPDPDPVLPPDNMPYPPVIIIPPPETAPPGVPPPSCPIGYLPLWVEGEQRWSCYNGQHQFFPPTELTTTEPVYAISPYVTEQEIVASIQQTYEAIGLPVDYNPPTEPTIVVSGADIAAIQVQLEAELGRSPTTSELFSAAAGTYVSTAEVIGGQVGVVQ